MECDVLGDGGHEMINVEGVVGGSFLMAEARIGLTEPLFRDNGLITTRFPTLNFPDDLG